MELSASALAGAGTIIGALAALAGPSPRMLALFLGLASAVMLAVAVGDLLPTAVDFGGLGATAGGLLTGVVIIALLDQRIGTYLGATGNRYLKTGVLVLLGIALHDIPEGLAIAAGFAAAPQLGFLTAIMIGLHNVPEGMATAAPLRAGGMSPATVILINVLLSLVTPLGTLLGLFLGSTPLSICLLSAAAAGAMLYVVLFDLLPRSLHQDMSSTITGGLIGFIIFVLLILFLKQ